MAGSTSCDSKSDYRDTIYEIAQELSTENASDISFLSAISSSAQQDGCCCNHDHHHQYHRHASNSSPQLTLLQLMESRGVYSENDLEPLTALLREIGRHDLASKCGNLPAAGEVDKDLSKPGKRVMAQQLG